MTARCEVRGVGGEQGNGSRVSIGVERDTIAGTSLIILGLAVNLESGHSKDGEALWVRLEDIC